MGHDVFISYARLDDVPCCGDTENRWIKRLKVALSDDLSTRLGRPADVFYDKKDIKDGDVFKETIKDALKESSTMLVVLSPTWVKSDPCKSEYRFYQAEKDSTGSNTLIIERIDIEPEDWNLLKKLFRKLDEIQRRKFYRTEEDGVTKTYGVFEDEPSFYQETSELGWMIKKKLAEAKDRTDAKEKRVFIYCATEDLSDTSRDYLLQLQRELRDFLDDEMSVGMYLHDWLTNESAYADADARDLAITEEIRKCDHFVQLVTKNSHGQVVTATEALDIARALGKPCSIWSASVTSDENITFSGPFEDFKQEVLARLRGDEQKQEDIEVSSDTEQYAFIDRGDDYYGSQLFELVDELKAKGIKVEADESEDDIDVLERALDDPACAAIVTIRREKRPRILNARIDAELDHQIALHCKNRPLHRLILNSCGLENEQISQELSSSDWKIANNLEDLLGNLQINNFRYNSYSKE